MDETYIKVKGKWMYYYRAIDKFGKTLTSCFLSIWMKQQPPYFSPAQ